MAIRVDAQTTLTRGTNHNRHMSAALTTLVCDQSKDYEVKDVEGLGPSDAGDHTIHSSTTLNMRATLYASPGCPLLVPRKPYISPGCPLRVPRKPAVSHTRGVQEETLLLTGLVRFV